MTDKERKDLRIELKSRQIVLHKLNVALNSLISRKIPKIIEERQKRIEQLSEYKNEDEIADAYGWGFMSEEEYDRLLFQFREGKQAIETEQSSEEIAADILRGWIQITQSDVYSLRFELLSEKKKEEIRQRNYEIALKREERRKNHD